MTVPTGVFEAEEIGAASQEPAPDEFRLMDEILSPPPSQSTASPAGAGPEPGRRPCPECGEMIVAGAAKCRFCNAIFDPSLKVRASNKVYGPSDADLSTGDWVFCILCGGIACIVGIVYAIQGKPKGMKMVGVSLVAGVLWGVIRVIIETAMHQAPHHLR
jgi:hypothetical protein